MALENTPGNDTPNVTGEGSNGGVVGTIQHFIGSMINPREQLLSEIKDSFQAATRTEGYQSQNSADASSAPNRLTAVEHQLGALAIMDGGKHTRQFAQDVDLLNQRMEPSNSLARVLPLLRLSGLDNNGHVQVVDQADGKVENLTVRDGILGPDAPLDSAVHHALFLSPKGQGRDSKLDLIAASNVEQARLGDCYFMAALQQLARKNPTAIKNMIQDNGPSRDGRHTYTVRFPGQGKQGIVVSEPTIYEVTAFGQDSQGLWTSVAEKAYRRLMGYNLQTVGNSAAWGLELLTGKKSTSTLTWNPDLTQALSSVNRNNIMATGATGNYDYKTVTDIRGNHLRIIGDHIYGIESYDAKNQTVTISNPWGYNEADKLVNPDPANVHVKDKFDPIRASDPAEPKTALTGRLATISLSDFKKTFNDFAFVQTS
jgi:hypothetical protein